MKSTSGLTSPERFCNAMKKATGVTTWPMVSRCLIRLMWNCCHLGSIGWWIRLPLPPDPTGAVYRWRPYPLPQVTQNVTQIAFRHKRGHPKAASLLHILFYYQCLMFGAPYENRTRVSALRGRRPGPLDEGSVAAMVTNTNPLSVERPW